MPALSKETLETVAGILEGLAVSLALASAVAGIGFFAANRLLKPLQEKEALEQRKDFLALTERAAKAERELLEVKERMTDRTLNKEQEARLVSDLRVIDKIPVQLRVSMSDAEARRFARLLKKPFQDAGWEAAILTMTILPPRGIGIVHPKIVPADDPRMELIKMALREVGLDPTTVPADGPAEPLTIIVGGRP